MSVIHLDADNKYDQILSHFFFQFNLSTTHELEAEPCLTTETRPEKASVRMMTTATPVTFFLVCYGNQKVRSMGKL